MDAELIIIFVFVMLAASLVFGMAQLFHSRSVRHEERKLELKARIEEARQGQAEASREAYQLLEDRMRVIERIVTDPSADLSRQIEDLRALDAEREERVQ